MHLATLVQRPICLKWREKVPFNYYVVEVLPSGHCEDHRSKATFAEAQWTQKLSWKVYLTLLNFNNSSILLRGGEVM